MRSAVKPRQAAVGAQARRAARGRGDLHPRPGKARPGKEGLAIAELARHLGYFLRRLQVAVFKDFIRTLAPVNLRPAQYSVLILIETNPGRSQAAIGKALDIERARLARLLHELERRGLIERRPASRDARSHALYLTGAGASAMARIKRLAMQHETRMSDLLGPRRRMLLMDLLKDFG